MPGDCSYEYKKQSDGTFIPEIISNDFKSIIKDCKCNNDYFPCLPDSQNLDCTSSEFKNILDTASERSCENFYVCLSSDIDNIGIANFYNTKAISELPCKKYYKKETEKQKINFDTMGLSEKIMKKHILQDYYTQYLKVKYDKRKIRVPRSVYSNSTNTSIPVIQNFSTEIIHTTGNPIITNISTANISSNETSNETYWPTISIGNHTFINRNNTTTIRPKLLSDTGIVLIVVGIVLLIGGLATLGVCVKGTGSDQSNDHENTE